MAYVTGAANSLTDLLTALRNACVANGWTLSGNVLSKGGCYVRTQVNIEQEETDVPVGFRLVVQAGNGIDGSNNLTDTTIGAARLGPLRAATGSTYPDWDWPVTYHIHINTAPDEVWLAVAYSAGQFFQHLAFGKSPAPGNAGTGNWHFATLPHCPTSTFWRRVNNCAMAPNGAAVNSFNGSWFSPAPFWWASKEFSFDVRLSAQMHGAIHSGTGLPMWSSDAGVFGTAGGQEAVTSAAITQQPLLGYSPNTWNNETILVPCQVMQERPSSKGSIIGELQHLRYARNDYIDPGAVITLGSDKWKVYPCYRKNAAARDGGGPIDHSGTVAVAIRYDGP